MAGDRVETLVKGLRKAVADPQTTWVDANIIHLLLDRYDNHENRELE